MYSPKIVEQRREALCSRFGIADLEEKTPQEVDGWIAQLADARDAKGNQARELSQEEQAFIRNELILCKSSFRYWAERYVTCSKGGAGIAKMFPLFAAQELLLAEIGRMEEASVAGETEDGVLINVLKARRMGASTLAEAMIAHRITLQTHLYAVVASDTPESSSYTIGMHQMIYDGLPWWLKPGLVSFSNTYPEMYEYSNGSQVWGHSGKSSRGVTGERGQIGRGKGISLCHLTELATWEDTQQIGGALLPTMEPSPRILAIFESSPLGRGGWWHTQWQVSREGRSRFHPVFIPWYAEPKKYRKGAPGGWVPKDSTLAHAKRCESQGDQWIHTQVRLTREQLYWYEFTRDTYAAQDDLATFLREYAADPEECFVFSGRSAVPFETIQRVVDQARLLAGAFEVTALKDIRSSL